MTKPVLCARGVSFQYKNAKKEQNSWKDLQFEACSSSVVSILGESGIGKTTFLNILAGLITELDSGSVYIRSGIEEKRVSQPESSIYVVFQDFNNAILPWLTVKQNILLGQYKASKKVDDEVLKHTIEKLFKEFTEDEYSGFLKTYPNDLSGGQKQRLQVARALVADAQFILFDEPDSAVDFRTKSCIREIIKYLADIKGVGVVIITHDIDNAISYSDKIYLMTKNKNGSGLYDFPVPSTFKVAKDISELQEKKEYWSFKDQIIKKLYPD